MNETNHTREGTPVSDHRRRLERAQLEVREAQLGLTAAGPAELGDGELSAVMERARLSVAQGHGDARQGAEDQRAAAKAEALKEETLKALEKELGKRYSREQVRLDRFRVYDPRQKRVLERMQTVLAGMADFAAKGRGLVLYGTVGTGKDHMLAAALYAAAAAGFRCRWVNGLDLFGRIRDDMDTKRREEDLIRELAEPEVLGISDPVPPAGNLSEWNAMQLLRVLDRRYRAMRPTWVTVNALSEEEAEAALSSPTFRRLRELAELMLCVWPSYSDRL